MKKIFALECMLALPWEWDQKDFANLSAGKGYCAFQQKIMIFHPLEKHIMQCRHNPIHLYGINCLHEVQQTMGLLNKSYLTRVKYYVWSCNAVGFCSFSDDVFCLLKPPLGDQPPWRLRNDPAERVQSNKPPFAYKELLKGPTHCSRQKNLQTCYIS